MDKHTHGTTKAHDKSSDRSTGTAHGTKGTDNPNPGASSSGLDTQGQFRIGDRITLAVRGDGLVLTQSHSGREAEISEAELAGLLDDKYFVAHHKG